MSDTIDWRILDRHLAGESSAEDDAALRQWLADDPRNAELLRGIASGLSSGAAAESRWNVERAWSRMAGKTRDADAPIPLARPISARPARSLRQRGLWRAGIASGAMIAATLVAVVWAARTPRAASSIAPPAHEIAASNAQQTRVTLRDGTRVVLNASSRLRYADDFGVAARDVELEGEGYFEVVHDATRPFRVRARGSVTEDLGTRFVVRAYAEQAGVEVVVAEGSVSLSRDRATEAPALLRAGQRGRLSAEGGVTVDVTDVARSLEWTRGGLVLDGLTLGEAGIEIGRRFDVQVEVVGTELARRRVSARFRDEPLPRVLDALAAALGARWTRDGDRVVITRGE